MLAGQVALITGAGRGIGRAAAELLASQGAAVVLTARSVAELEEVTGVIRERGGTADYYAGDLVEEATVNGVFDLVKSRHDRLDILVNNAGIAPGGGVEQCTVETFRKCLELNVIAAFACLQQAVGMMRPQGGGKVINIGSVRSHWTEGGSAGAYNASKYALRAMVESVARELHGSGANIAVSLICPGGVDTTLVNPSREPRPNLLRPEEVARAILHAAVAPPGVNVYDITVFSTHQKPW